MLNSLPGEVEGLPWREGANQRGGNSHLMGFYALGGNLISWRKKKRRHQEGQKFEKKSSKFERITQEVGLSQGVEGSFSWNHEDIVDVVCSAVCLFPAVPAFRCSVQKAVIGSLKTFWRVLKKRQSQGRLSICHRLLKCWLLDSKLVGRGVRKGRWWTEQGKGQWTGHPSEVEGQLQREHIVGRNQGRMF